MKTLLSLLLAAALAAGCASEPKQPGQKKPSYGERVLARYDGYIGAPIRGFTALRQQSWQSVSRTQLILWTSNRDAFLITVRPGCHDLMFADAIRVTTTVSEVTVHESVFVRGERCLIEKIQPIDIRQMRADEKELRDNPQPAKPDQ
jgi:hypothetical protein